MRDVPVVRESPLVVVDPATNIAHCAEDECFTINDADYWHEKRTICRDEWCDGWLPWSGPPTCLWCAASRR